MILGIAAIQGIFLSIILFLNKRGNKLSNQVLSVLVFFFSLILIEESLESLEIHHQYVRITGSGFMLDLLLGPLTFLYAAIIVERGFKLRKKYLVHLVIPVVLNLIYLPYHLWVGWDTHLINNQSLSTFFTILIVTKIVYQVIYQLVSIRKLRAFIIAEGSGSKDKPRYKMAVWLRNVLTLAIILIPMVLLIEGVQDRLIIDSDFLTSLIMIFSIYSVGYAALRNPMIYTRPSDISKVNALPFLEESAQKYSTSSLSSEQKESFKSQLVQYMTEQQPYLRPDLTANDLATDLSLTRHNLSQILNEVFDQNFYDFVNAYRVREVIRRIQLEDHLKINILALGLESGFNSKATFNRAFKKSQGITPVDYIKNLETA